MAQNIEDRISAEFAEYYDLSDSELFQALRMPQTQAKSKLYLISTKIIARSGLMLSALEREGFEMKTVRLESDGSLKESMSFKQIDYEGIVDETWESSYWRHTLRKRFIFVVFQKDRQGVVRLRKVKFWSMPDDDLSTARDFWEHTKRNVRANDYNNFILQSDDMICHVRPKARDSRDFAPTPQGGMAPKKAYWLNSNYIRRIIGI